MVRVSRGSISDGGIGAGVRGPASSPLSSRWARSYATRREGSRRHGSCPNRPSGCPEGVGSPPGGDGPSQDVNRWTGSAGATPPVPSAVGRSRCRASQGLGLPWGDRAPTRSGDRIASRDRDPWRSPAAPPGLSASPLRPALPVRRRPSSTAAWPSPGRGPIPLTASTWLIWRKAGRNADLRPLMATSLRREPRKGDPYHDRRSRRRGFPSLFAGGGTQGIRPSS